MRPSRHRVPAACRAWDPEDLFAPGSVGWLHRDASIESARAQQRGVQYVRSVCRGKNDHAGRRIEAVHLGQDLIQRLLALVVATAEAGEAGGARAADRIELVDEDDRRRSRFGLREQVAHTRGADTNDRLDELRCSQGEEGDIRFPCDRLRQERLPGAGRAGKQHPARDASSQATVLFGVAQEVDDLDELVLGLLYAGDVLEGDAVARGLVAPRA